MNIINLTPHEISVHTHVGATATYIGDVVNVPASGNVARVDETRTIINELMPMGITVDVVSYSDVTGLPEPQENTIYIVSALVAARVPERRDVYMPGKAVRDDEGRIIGCEGLSQVPAPVSVDPDAPYPDIDPWDDMGFPTTVSIQVDIQSEDEQHDYENLAALLGAGVIFDWKQSPVKVTFFRKREVR